MKTAKEIDATAADWAARIDRGPLTADEERALTLWMDSETRNRGAFMRMRAIALHTERAQALGPNFVPDNFIARSVEALPGSAQRGAPALRRRVSRMRLWVAAAAACAGVAIALQLMHGGVDYDTRQGEVRVVSLDDGSVMTLNTASRVEVSFEKDIRRVRLIEGEALFDVAKDKARPFVVAAGDTSVRAIGTSFTVQRLAGQPIQILVREGLVEVRQPSLATPMRVPANMRAEMPANPRDTAPKPMAMRPDAINRELAWRDGRIVFEAETLDRAAVAFARYSQTRIVIDDPVVARKEITGLFTANDPVSFAKAAATSLGLKAEVRGGEVRLSR